MPRPVLSLSVSLFLAASIVKSAAALADVPVDQKASDLSQLSAPISTSPSMITESMLKPLWRRTFAIASPSIGAPVRLA